MYHVTVSYDKEGVEPSAVVLHCECGWKVPASVGNGAKATAEDHILSAHGSGAIRAGRVTQKYEHYVRVAVKENANG